MRGWATKIKKNNKEKKMNKKVTMSFVEFLNSMGMRWNEYDNGTTFLSDVELSNRYREYIKSTDETAYEHPLVFHEWLRQHTPISARGFAGLDEELKSYFIEEYMFYRRNIVLLPFPIWVKKAFQISLENISDADWTRYESLYRQCIQNWGIKNAGYYILRPLIPTTKIKNY